MKRYSRFVRVRSTRGQTPASQQVLKNLERRVSQLTALPTVNQEYLSVEVLKKGEIDKAHLDYTSLEYMELDGQTLEMIEGGNINREVSMIWCGIACL